MLENAGVSKYILLCSRRNADEEAFENILVWSGPYKEVKSSKYDVMVNYFGSNLSM